MTLSAQLETATTRRRPGTATTVGLHTGPGRARPQKMRSDHAPARQAGNRWTGSAPRGRGHGSGDCGPPVQPPGLRRSAVAEPDDGKARPLGTVLGTPRCSPLHDGDRARAELNLEADMVQCLGGNALVAEA